jgi:NitT/TauT family transport system substrate-binding protein
MRVRLPWFLLLVVLAAGCKRSGDDPNRPLRLGFFPNLTHAQALVGNAEGTFARALDGRLEVKQFNAGPSAMEALLAGSIDASYVGSGPAVTAYIRSEGQLRLIAGSASGGAVLISRKEIDRVEQLHGQRLATPQLGNTQDIAARVWLKKQGEKILDRPGPNGVAVTPLANSDILGLFRRGDLAAAWVPEPWGARLLAEANGKILVDERSLWPGGAFPTTVLVVSTKVLERRREDVKKLLRAHLELTRRARGDEAKFALEANAAFGKITGKPLPEPVLRDAFSRIDLTTDPLEAQLALSAKNAHELGFIPSEDVRGLVDASLLRELEAAPAPAPTPEKP